MELVSCMCTRAIMVPLKVVSFGMKVSNYCGKCCSGVFDGTPLEFGVLSFPVFSS